MRVSKFIIFFVFLSFSLGLYAQVSNPKVINLVKAGTLNKFILEKERLNLTNLVLKGNIDSRDFRFIRDSLQNIKTLNLFDAKVNAYTGKLGTNLVVDSVLEEYAQHYSVYRVPGYNCISTFEENTIPSEAFYNRKNNKALTSLELVVLPKSTTCVDEYSFFHCKNLKSVKFPTTLKVIRRNAFTDTDSLSNIILPEGLDSIGIGCFYNCKSLKTIKLPNNLVDLANSSFYACVSLESVTIGPNLKSIEDQAFFFCENLRTINCHTIKPIIISQKAKVFDKKIFQSCTLHIPKGSRILYQSAEVWKGFFKIIDDL